MGAGYLHKTRRRKSITAAKSFKKQRPEEKLSRFVSVHPEAVKIAHFPWACGQIVQGPQMAKYRCW
jgi:hypothetical protein